MKLLNKNSHIKEAKRIYKEKYASIGSVNILIREKENLEKVISSESNSEQLLVDEVLFSLISSRIDALKNKENSVFDYIY